MRRLMITLTLILCCISLFAVGEPEWVDMGTRTKDGDIVYWSSSDFICSNHYSKGYTFAGKGENGSLVKWGDITGMKEGTDIADFGGYNCPKIIAGDPKYDIVTALMGSPYRLPTLYDTYELMENVTQSVKVIGRRKVTPNGAPDWVQGQWQWQDGMLVNGRVGNASISVKFDGHLASVYTSEGDMWEGAWSYSNGTIRVWKLTLNVVGSDRVLRDEKGYTYRKISDNSSSGEIKVIVLTSNINGNQLYIPMPTDFSTGTSYDGEFVIAYHNDPVSHDYWIGEVSPKNSSKALYFNADGATEDPRYAQHYIRAIKVDIGSGQREKEKLWSEINTLIEQRTNQANTNIKLANQLKRRDSDDYLRYISKSNEILESKILVLDKSKSKDQLKRQISELRENEQALQEEYSRIYKKVEEKNSNAQSCARTVFNELLSVSFNKTLIDYKVSAINLDHGFVQFRVCIYENKNTEKFRKDFWKKIEKMSNNISKEELSKEILFNTDPGYEVKIKGNSLLGSLFRHHFEKTKEQRFTYGIAREAFSNGHGMGDFAEVVNDSIRKALADFSITDAQGRTYTFAYDPSFSSRNLDVFYVDSVNFFRPLYRYQGEDLSAIDSRFIKNVSSISDGFFQWVNPFLIHEEKNKELFVCDITLPYSESYIFSSDGHKQQSVKPSSKHSVNPKYKTRETLFGESMLRHYIENRNTTRSNSRYMEPRGASKYYNGSYMRNAPRQSGGSNNSGRSQSSRSRTPRRK